jgi:NAD(P)-dependent dehydrogenase (short-subunit alcohol dehydrogenase family)
MHLGLDGLNALVTYAMFSSLYSVARVLISIGKSGGSRGIGRAIVKELLAEGCNVAYCARRCTGSEFEGQAAPGRSAVGTALDVANKEALEKWVVDSAKAFNGIDIVISNCRVVFISDSGEFIADLISKGSGFAVPDTLENWNISFQIDMLAAVNLVNAAMPYLERSKHASITTISSVSVRLPNRRLIWFVTWINLATSRVSKVISPARVLMDHSRLP